MVMAIATERRNVMLTSEIANSLHPLEVKILLNFEGNEEVSHEAATGRLSFSTGQYNQAAAWLEDKGLVRLKRHTENMLFALTDLGQTYRLEGTPEERIIRLLREGGPKTIPEITEALGLPASETGSAYGRLSRDKFLSMDRSNRIGITSDCLPERVSAFRDLLEKTHDAGELSAKEVTPSELEALRSASRKRGATKGIFRGMERQTKSYEYTEAGITVRSLLLEQGTAGEEIGQLTPEMLRDGAWKGKNFRPYQTSVPPQRVLLGRKHAYVEFLEELKDKLVSLGFEELCGPLIEPEFWNADALYMPQFHSARDIHDVYYVKDPRYAEQIEGPYLEQVARTHENGWETGSRGWGYRFDRRRTHRLVLRSQGTVLSAKALRHAKVPGKYFGVARCFRYDQVDATHLPDFYQTEGIVLGENVNLRTLLGLLEMFAVEVARAKEIRYVPGYFPFTEPSVEVHVKHPVLGWFELGGSGVFRPEVTQPLGVSVPVLAWGLGIDRMALMSLGINDIRGLFSHDIERVRLSRRNTPCLR